MKRDNSMDVALRDIDYIRERGRQSRAHASHIITKASVGACGVLDGNCAAAEQAPVCPDFSMDYLCANYAQVVVVFRALAAGATTEVTFNPIDQVFCGVAISGSVWDDADVNLSRTSWVFRVQARGCDQLDFTTPATVAGATGFIDTRPDWDPTFKNSCKACPIDWSCFTNTGTGTIPLTMQVGNPNSAPISGRYVIWGIPYSCCPGFTSLEDMRKGVKPTRGLPPGPPKPGGTAKRAGGTSPFA